MPAVSVIVPVYKTPKAFLQACVDSVLNQSLDDFELILIDDGSPDECGLWCDELARKDSRIIVLHQENKGASAARNLGIEKSTGKYTLFLDSDDSLELESLASLYAMAENNQSEVVLFGYRQNGIEYALFDSVSKSNLNQEQYKMVYESTVVPRREQGVLLCGVCCKFYRSELLRRCNASFFEKLTSAEDQIFFLSLLNAQPKMSYLAEPFYEYRFVEHSASFSYTPDFSNQVQIYFNLLKGLLENYNISNKDILLGTRLCQCILYALSKDFFHRDNPQTIAKRKCSFRQFASRPENQEAFDVYDRSRFCFSERIGLWLVKKKFFWLIKLASLRW